MYFLGIDGGGTKTDFLLLDENGKTIAQRKIGTISYKHVGMDYVTELLRENINQILDKYTDLSQKKIKTIVYVNLNKNTKKYINSKS